MVGIDSGMALRLTLALIASRHGIERYGQPLTMLTVATLALLV